MLINIIGPINKLSYGVVTTNLCIALEKEGANVSLFPIGPNMEFNKQSDRNHIMRMVDRGRNSYWNLAPCVRIWHQFDLAQYVGKGDHYAFPIFELDNFGDNELHQLNSAQNIIVCSEWAKRVIENRTNKSAHVVPLGVDRSVFMPTVENRSPNTVKYMCGGKLEKRKMHKEIAECFSAAFTPFDDVELHFYTHNPFLKMEEMTDWVGFVKSLKLGHKMFVHPLVNTQEDLCYIYNCNDIYIGVSRAEGFNLCLLEAMSCGLQCISSYNTAHTEFCSNANSHLIYPIGKEVAEDGRWFFPERTNSGQWSEFEKKDIIGALKKTYKEIKEKARLNEYGIETAKKFSWEASAQKLINILGE